MKRIGHINSLYDIGNSWNDIECNYEKHDVIDAFEIIYGKIKVPKTDLLDVNIKIRTVNEFMAKRHSCKYLLI